MFQMIRLCNRTEYVYTYMVTYLCIYCMCFPSMSSGLRGFGSRMVSLRFMYLNLWVQVYCGHNLRTPPQNIEKVSNFPLFWLAGHDSGGTEGLKGELWMGCSECGGGGGGALQFWVHAGA